MTNTERLKGIASLYQAIGQDDDANAILALIESYEALLSALKPFIDLAAEVEKINGHADRHDSQPVWGVNGVMLRLGDFRAIAKVEAL